MQSSRTPRKSCKARRCVHRSLLMRLQDAMTGPPAILSFKKPNRVFDRVRRGAATSSGQSPTLAWPSLGYPSRAPRARKLRFLSPGPRSSDPPRALASVRELSSSLERQKSVDRPPQRRRRGPEQQGQGKVQTGEKIRAPLAQRAKKTNSHLHHTIRPGGSWSPGGCS